MSNICTVLLITWLMSVTSYVPYICAFIPIHQCQKFGMYGIHAHVGGHICFWQIFYYIGNSNTLVILMMTEYWYMKISSVWNANLSEILIHRNSNTSETPIHWTFSDSDMPVVQYVIMSIHLKCDNSDISDTSEIEIHWKYRFQNSDYSNMLESLMNWKFQYVSNSAMLGITVYLEFWYICILIIPICWQFWYSGNSSTLKFQ